MDKLIFISFHLFLIFANSVEAQTVAKTYRLLHTLNEVFRTVRQESVKPLSDESLIEGAVNGMLKVVDPYSSYIPPERYKIMLTDFKGEVYGVGLELTQEGDLIKVVTPFEGSPAWHANIKPGDILASVDGKTLQGLSLFEVGDLLQGHKGENVKLEITRVGLPSSFFVSLKRQKIILNNIRWSVEGDIAYIRLANFFHRHTSLFLKKALKEILSKNVRGIVLDLRNNPGGLLDQALKSTNLFIEKKLLVQVQGRSKEKNHFYNATESALVPDGLLVVLINEGTASCAEIMAGALQDHGRALIVGVPSFGKGTVQSIIPLSPGYSAIQLTTGHYLTPSGRNIQGTGIQPDFVVPQEKSKEDVQKNAAFRTIQSQNLSAS